jgi:hypothetical protein
MASVCATPIKGTTIRVVQLDVCGNPVTGVGSHAVITNSFTQVQMDPQYEDGTDFFEKTADGLVGVNDIDAPILKRMRLTTDLLTIDPDMMPYVLSARELVTTAPVSGYGFALAEGPSSAHFSLEVWQRVAGSGVCSPSGVPYYIYNAWPHCYNTRVGQYTISNARSGLQFMCDTKGAGPQWADGPGSGASGLPPATGALVIDHWLWNITTVAPPAAQCGFIPVT